MMHGGSRCRGKEGVDLISRVWTSTALWIADLGAAINIGK